MTQQNNMIALSVPNNSVATITNDLFKDIDFAGIANAIDNIGNHNSALTVEEKEMANGIVEQWEQDVISRLRDKDYEFKSFISFIEDVGSYGRIAKPELFEDLGEDLAVKTNTVKQYNAVKTALQELEDHHQTRPLEPIEDEDRTYKEKLEQEQQYRVDITKYNVKETKLQREVYKAEYEWKKLVKQNKEVSELLKKAKRFNKDLNKFTEMCHDKAQVAKLNITVSNQDVRDSLRELLSFSSTI